jgi:glyoxylase-like metal-dependent hydrolase (beta-lactamase superfamily II)
MIRRKALPLLVLLLPFTLAAQPSPSGQASSPFVLKSLGHGVYAATDDGKGDAGANAGFVIGETGVAVIDTFQKPAAAEALLAAIRDKTRLPVRFVINTHYHIDHVTGNRLFHDQGAVVLAQRNVRAWIHTENLKFFGKEIAPKDRAAVENLYGPDLLYDGGIEISLGEEKIVVRSYPGHTGGDSVVVVPGAKVVFCGDLFWRKTLPNMIDATARDWIPTLDALRNLPDAGSLTYVPGHGEPGTAADVADFQGYLADLRSLAEGPVQEGKEGDALTQAILPDLQKKYGTWDFFSYFAKPDIQDMAAELRGVKTVPRPAAD